MNPFLEESKERHEPPVRLYARVDSVETLDPAGDEILVYAAGVDAGWYDEIFGRYADTVDLPPSAMERMDGAPLAVTEFWLPGLDEKNKDGWREVIRPGTWLTIQQDTAGIAATQYTSLFGAASPTQVSIEQVRRQFARQLDAAFSLSGVPDYSPTDIEDLLRGVGRVDFVSVLDVGQGNACGLWRSKGGALMYFDIGGGAVANSKTFPTGKINPCRTNRPPVVLSHWDWDHWSSAMRFPDMLDSSWLAPRQQLDPVHLAFAYQLHKRGSLRLWPDGLSAASGGVLRLERCSNGIVGDKNNNGLAITIEGDGFGPGPYRALLPGDADFDSVPSVAKGEQFDAIVASHHGAQVKGISAVKAPANRPALVYSVGHGNSYGHPRIHAIAEYLNAGWDVRRTYATTQSRRKRPCTIGLRIGAAPPVTGCGSCNPKFHS